MLITPEYVFKDVTHITPEWLAQKGIRALVLDIDNTLTADFELIKLRRPAGRCHGIAVLLAECPAQHRRRWRWSLPSEHP